MNYLLVALGGALGSLARYTLAQYVTYTHFPLKTLLANALGCLIMGFLMGKAASLDAKQLLLLTTGFCGGFTTLSTFSYEVVTLYQSGQVVAALGYGLASLVLALLAIIAGLFLAKL